MVVRAQMVLPQPFRLAGVQHCLPEAGFVKLLVPVARMHACRTKNRWNTV